MGRKARQATKVSPAIKKMVKKLIKWEKLESGLRSGVAAADCLKACFPCFVVVLRGYRCYIKTTQITKSFDNSFNSEESNKSYQ